MVTNWDSHVLQSNSCLCWSACACASVFQHRPLALFSGACDEKTKSRRDPHPRPLIMMMMMILTSGR